jgi:hypothetical protein
MKNFIKVGDKTYAKTLRFGNQKAKDVFKNKNKYSRKSKHLKHYREEQM